MKMTLPTDSAERKEIPLYSGVLKYAPAALAGMARISKAGNDKHNPGEPLHHARGKSNDHPDCIVRHAADVADIEAALQRSISDHRHGYDSQRRYRQGAADRGLAARLARGDVVAGAAREVRRCAAGAGGARAICG